MKSRSRAVFATAAILPAVIALVGVNAASAAAAPAASTGAVTAVKPASATVSGTVNPNGVTTSWAFEYGPASSGTFGARTAAHSAGAGSADVAVSASLTGLAPATSYEYRIVASSSAGSATGQTGLFNTSAAPTAVTAAASGLTATSANLNGVINAEGLTTTWFFQYGTTTKYGSRTPTQTAAAGPSDVNVSAAVTALTAQTTYHFRLVAKNSAGTRTGVDFSLTTGLAVTLNASTTTVVYGRFVTLSGVVGSGQAGDHVTVAAKPYNQSAFTGLAALSTTAGGSWTLAVQPSVRTTYEAITSAGASSPLVLSVRPAVFLHVVSGGRLTTHVVGGYSFATHVLQLQKLVHGFWVTWKPIRLGSKASTTFTTSLPKGRTPVRMAIGPFVAGIDQAGPGYLAGFSSVLNYVKR